MSSAFGSCRCRLNGPVAEGVALKLLQRWRTLGQNQLMPKKGRYQFCKSCLTSVCRQLNTGFLLSLERKRRCEALWKSGHHWHWRAIYKLHFFVESVHARLLKLERAESAENNTSQRSAILSKQLKVKSWSNETQNNDLRLFFRSGGQMLVPLRRNFVSRWSLFVDQSMLSSRFQLSIIFTATLRFNAEVVVWSIFQLRNEVLKWVYCVDTVAAVVVVNNFIPASFLRRPIKSLALIPSVEKRQLGVFFVPNLCFCFRPNR